jgi:glutathione S-transferase
MTRPVVYHIPVCPFSQRLKILLALKGHPDAVEFVVVDITVPRDPALLAKTRGTTALPVLETADGRILKESLVILGYLDETIPGGLQRRTDPYEHAVEQMLIAQEGPFTGAGYMFVMNQDPATRPSHEQRMLSLYAKLDAFLMEHAPDRTFLFEEPGLAEAVFTPMFMRFWFLEYFEEFDLPQTTEFARVRRWRDACLAHPATQQTTREEVVKNYYDYAKGAGNGALLPGRTRSSFVFEPPIAARPWPPKDKYNHLASDAVLGLV